MKPEGGGITASFRRAFTGFSLDVSLAVPGRGVTAVFGPSGSGKTSLLRCIAGLERSGSGYLAVNAEVWQDDAAGIFLPVHRRPLGYVFQEASLFEHLDVARNLDFGLRRVPPAQRRVSLEQAIELLGLQALMQRMPGPLSGGERQRVAIARALATSPRLLLMDEPLASLDLARKAEILPYLERLHAQSRQARRDPPQPGLQAAADGVRHAGREKSRRQAGQDHRRADRAAQPLFADRQIGRASCRERV